MQLTRMKFKYGDLSALNARFIEIPYQGDEFSMIIILPNEISGLKHVQDNLHRLKLKETLQRTYPDEIELYLPRFRIESTVNLREALEKLGMIDMFQNHANFSGISETPLKVSRVAQKAFIEVNEKGSVAAAVTGVGMTFRSARMKRPPTFRIDRPHLYAIYHNKTGVSLFTGIVKRPNWP